MGSRRVQKGLVSDERTIRAWLRGKCLILFSRQKSVLRTAEEENITSHPLAPVGANQLVTFLVPLLVAFLGFSDYVSNTLKHLIAFAVDCHWPFSP